MASCPGCSAENHPGSSFCWQCYGPSPQPRPPRPGLMPRHRRPRPERRAGEVAHLDPRSRQHPPPHLDRLPRAVAHRGRVEVPRGSSGRAARLDGGSGARGEPRVRGVRTGGGGGPGDLRGGGHLRQVQPGVRRDGGVGAGRRPPGREALGAPLDRGGVAFKKAQIRSFQSPTAFFACVPFVGIVGGTLCLWNGSGTSGVVYAYSMDMRAARDLSEEIQAAVGR